VAADCLRDAYAVPERLRVIGPMRCATIGPGGWAAADEVVAAMAPSDDAGWDEVAAVILRPHVIAATA
jgi:hypothetical protein